MHPIFAKRRRRRRCRSCSSPPANFTQATQILDAREHAFVRAAGFEPKPGKHLHGAGRRTASSPACCSAWKMPTSRSRTCSARARWPALLPPGTYRFANAPHDARLGALAFALGLYQFARYRKAQARDVRLVVPDGVDGEDLSRIVEGVTLARDLINTPSNDMGPAELEAAARALAEQHGAKVQVTSGDALAKEFPAGCRGRRRLGARAAADRSHLGQRRATRRSRWSARASASTPAASTSRPTPACST